MGMTLYSHRGKVPSVLVRAWRADTTFCPFSVALYPRPPNFPHGTLAGIAQERDHCNARYHFNHNLLIVVQHT